MKPTLLVLAAGLGTRYGGLKQIDSVGPAGQTLIDYSIYDAIRAGFGKVVCVIRHYFEDAFKEKVSSKFDGFVQTEYMYQETDKCLGDFARPADRDKPWGTAHAILVSEETINEPFAVINADDYYGIGSLRTMVAFLSANDPSPSEYAMVGYALKNTLSEYGAVARGICECGDRMLLRSVVERRGIQKTPQGIRYTDPDGTSGQLSGEQIVSMNLWGFQPSVFSHLRAQFARFLAEHGRDPQSELFIPTAVDEMITTGKASVRVLRTQDSWFGITYRPDRAVAAACIRERIEQGLYPERLWDRG